MFDPDLDKLPTNIFYEFISFMDIKGMWSATVERNETEQDRDQRCVLVKRFGSSNKGSGLYLESVRSDSLFGN